MKNIIITSALSLIFLCITNTVYGQLNSEIALGYTGTIVNNKMTHGFTTSLLFNPGNHKSSFGAFFDQVSSQKIDVNAPNNNGAQFEMISTGGQYQFKALNKSRFRINLGLRLSYDRLRYIDASESGGIIDLGIFTIVKNRETLTTANAMSLQPLLSLSYYIKNAFGIKLEQNYRLSLNDTSILSRDQMSGYQLKLALFHNF